MNIAILMLITIPVFWLAYRYYGRYIDKVFDVDDSRPTPAVTMKDDVDYVPTKTGVVFSHHFASIAGAGPIVGPTVAMIFGYIPVWLWVLLGGVFIGAVHDFTALFVSVREKGKSMAEVSDHTLGRAGFLLFIGFTIALLVLVTSSFMQLTATALGSLVPLKDMGLEVGKTVLHVKDVNGIPNAQIGGIASMSVIILTLFAPLIGWLLYKKNINVYLGSLLAILVGILSIAVGIFYPITFKPEVWMIILSIYTFLAAGIPVWAILQPRDFTNSFILYIGIIALVVGVFGGGLAGVKLIAPALNLTEGVKLAGAIWPFLFITVACGAISGFHALVAGGTVSKQVSREKDIRTIGYGAMLIESLLAAGVILAISGGLNFETYRNIVYPTVAGVKSNPILAFALSVGSLLHKSVGLPVSAGTVFGILMVEGFVVTTLDTAVRLNRYLFEELWAALFKNPPKILKSYFLNAGIAVALMWYFGATNLFSLIWPIFGSANQLLAALSLIAVSVWLASKKKPTWFTVLPAIFMMVTTLWSLFKLLFTKYLPLGNMTLAVTDIILVLLGIGVILLAISKLFAFRKPSVSA
ncbi:MAG: carbon starvation protein A [Firmicutes bacterium]|nr:carbon starvation protein A [Bacillota bacterium]